MTLRARTDAFRRFCLVLLVVSLPAAARAQDDVRSAYAEAAALHQAGDLTGAVEGYRAVVALEPGVAAVWSDLGVALAALGRYGEAIESYRQALAITPGDTRIRSNLAIAHYKSGDLAHAAEELAALHAAQPDELRVTLLLADCQLRLGEAEAAVELLRPAEKAHPDNRALLYLLGMALVRSDRAAEGQPFVSRLMEGGSSAEAHYLLGSAALAAGNSLESLESFEKALELNPKLPSLRAYYGRALLSTGDPDGAIQAFHEALADNPNDYDAHYYLASILATRRQVDEARPYAERALQLRPQSQEVRDLLASLDDPEGLPRFEDSSPLVGQRAPDVVLQRPDGSAYRLSSLRGKPVLLAFGSFTCPWFRHGAPFLTDLHQRYGDRVEFRMVYIREAHPEGGDWESTINEREGVSLPVARSMADRAEHAAVCRRQMEIPFETALDAMDGEAEKAFEAFPSRAFLIDREGTVTFSSGLDEQRLHEKIFAAAVESVLQ